MSTLSPLEISLALAVMLAGSTVQGSIGFGMGLVVAPILALIDPTFAPGPILMNGITLTALVAWRERRHVRGEYVRWMLAGSAVGYVAAWAVLRQVSAEGFALAFGLLVLLAVALSAVGHKLRVSRRSLTGAGALSGFMSTMIAVGGPPVALLHQDSDGPTFRATLSAFFVVSASLSLATVAAAGRLGRNEIELGLLLLPALVAGFVLSYWTRGILDERGIRPVILLLSGAAGLALILGTLF